MSIIYKTSLLIIVAIMVVSCKEDPKQTPDPLVRALSANEAEVLDAANNFTFDLMTGVEAEFPEEKYFISSFSVSTAISMVMNGASGESQDQFRQALQLDGMSPEAINEAYSSLVQYIYGLDPTVTLNVANSTWYSEEYTIEDSFVNTLQEYYQAEIFERDFAKSATLDALNGWVETETNGKIRNILDTISPEEVMFLINAIYFKAIWTNPFDANETSDQPFFIENNQSVDVPMMSGEVKHWMAYDSQLETQLIEIPYGNENYAFTILMPDDPADVDGLVSRIDVTQLNAVLVDSSTVIRELNLPKFQLAFKTDLKNVLVEMGMPVAGLDNLFVEDLPLAISKVIHQSFLEVNEEGSEAAAATVIGIELTSLPASTNVNQPFVFLIRERNSGTILFSGKLRDPR
ncbi:MAG: serpin family protein [Bacteroidota bacterium]